MFSMRRSEAKGTGTMAKRQAATDPAVIRRGITSFQTTANVGYRNCSKGGTVMFSVSRDHGVKDEAHGTISQVLSSPAASVVMEKKSVTSAPLVLCSQVNTQLLYLKLGTKQSALYLPSLVPSQPCHEIT